MYIVHNAQHVVSCIFQCYQLTFVYVLQYEMSFSQKSFFLRLNHHLIFLVSKSSQSKNQSLSQNIFFFFFSNQNY